MTRWLIILGIVLIVAGLLWPWIRKLGLGRLPGNVVVERENVGCSSDHDLDPDQRRAVADPMVPEPVIRRGRLLG